MFSICMFGPFAMFAQLKSVVAPEYDHGIFVHSLFFQCIDNFAYLCIHVTYTGIIAPDKLALHLFRNRIRKIVTVYFFVLGEKKFVMPFGWPPALSQCKLIRFI